MNAARIATIPDKPRRASLPPQMPRRTSDNNADSSSDSGAPSNRGAHISAWWSPFSTRRILYGNSTSRFDR